ncbi:phthiocerol/phthiodiolone dimycocerosyl transferase family protein [Streptomyces sp. NPDC003703]|uniref:phthiocerol/phthiodiolone dimycocerosyl transferase family protein n=1 Tax=Streptomyces sp. NPDC003283 TaxID=3364681 RepID=UPI0036C9F606
MTRNCARSAPASSAAPSTEARHRTPFPSLDAAHAARLVTPVTVDRTRSTEQDGHASQPVPLGEPVRRGDENPGRAHHHGARRCRPRRARRGVRRGERRGARRPPVAAQPPGAGHRGQFPQPAEAPRTAVPGGTPRWPGRAGAGVEHAAAAGRPAGPRGAPDRRGRGHAGPRDRPRDLRRPQRDRPVCPPVAVLRRHQGRHALARPAHPGGLVGGDRRPPHTRHRDRRGRLCPGAARPGRRRPGRRPPVPRGPVPARWPPQQGRTQSRRPQLDVSETASLLAFARSSGVSVHGLVGAAVLAAVRSGLPAEYADHRLARVSTVDLRERVEPELSREVMVPAASWYQDLVDVPAGARARIDRHTPVKVVLAVLRILLEHLGR